MAPAGNSLHSQTRVLAGGGGGFKLNESIYESPGKASEPHRVVESLRASKSGLVTPAEQQLGEDWTEALKET